MLVEGTKEIRKMLMDIMNLWLQILKLRSGDEDGGKTSCDEKGNRLCPIRDTTMKAPYVQTLLIITREEKLSQI